MTQSNHCLGNDNTCSVANGVLPFSISYKRLALYILLFSIAIISTKAPLLGAFVGFAGVIAVIVLCVTKGPENAFLLYIPLLATSFEASAFVYGLNSSQSLYGFESLPVIGSFGMLISLIVVFLYSAFRYKVDPTRENDSRVLIIINRFVNVIFLVGLLMAAISYLTNDNGTAGLAWFPSLWALDTVRICTTLLFSKICILLLLNSKKFSSRLKNCLFHIMLASVPVAILFSLLGWCGYYYTSYGAILMPLVHFFSTGLILFYFFSKSSKIGIIALLAGIAMMILLFVFQSPLGGKWVIFQVVIIIVSAIVCTKKSRLLLFAIVPVVSILLLVALPNVLSQNEILDYKFNQAINIVSSVALGTSVDDSSHSAFMRIDEVINTGYEFAEKPWFLITGKGFGGSTAHHTSTFWNETGDFTSEQVSAGVFIRMHESLSILFLKSGVLGLLFFFYVLVVCLKRIRSNPWITMGLVWYVCFFAVYPTMGVFGSAALLVGLFDCDTKEVSV